MHLKNAVCKMAAFFHGLSEHVKNDLQNTYHYVMSIPNTARHLI